MTDYVAVFAAAAHLPVEERLRLIDDLAATLPDAQPPSLSREWEAEIDRRWEEIRSGAVKTIPWEEVEKRLDQIIGKPDASRNAS